MTNDNKYTFDAATGEEIISPMTDEEQEIRDAEVAANAAMKASKEAEDEAKLAAKEAVLAKLGLTVEEAAALLA
jgi:phosphoenolpyruvate carboxylase